MKIEVIEKVVNQIKEYLLEKEGMPVLVVYAIKNKEKSYRAGN